MENSAKKVRYIVIGTGGMGKAHIANLKHVQDAEIVGLVDPSDVAIRSTLTRFPELNQVPTFSGLADALQQCEADAAIVVTPHSMHFEQGMDCLDAGLNVLMEKPFVHGSKNAQQIIDFANTKQRLLAVSYQRHLQGPYMYLKQLVQSGDLGDIQFVSAYQAQAWQKGTVGTWRQELSLSCGGQLNDSGSHLLDVVLWVTGLSPQRVSACIDNRGSQVDIDTSLTVTFNTGATASFNIVGSSSIDWWEDVSIHGSRGSALYRNGKLFVAREGERSPKQVTDEEFAPSMSPDAHFTDLLLGRVSDCRLPAECGLKVATLTEAAWKSAAEGMPVVI